MTQTRVKTKTLDYHNYEDFMLFSIYDKPKLFSEFQKEARRQCAFLEPIKLSEKEYSDLFRVAPCDQFQALIDVKKLIVYAREHDDVMRRLRMAVIQEVSAEFADNLVDVAANRRGFGSATNAAMDLVCADWQIIAWYFLQNLTDEEHEAIKMYTEKQLIVRLEQLSRNKRFKKNMSARERVHDAVENADTRFPIFAAAMADPGSTGVLPKKETSYEDQISEMIRAAGEDAENAAALYAKQLLSALEFFMPDYRIERSNGRMLCLLQDLHSRWQEKNPEIKILQEDGSAKSEAAARAKKQCAFMIGTADAGETDHFSFADTLDAMKRKNRESRPQENSINAESVICSEFGYYSALLVKQGVDLYGLLDHTRISKKDALTITQDAFVDFKFTHGHFPGINNEDAKLFLPLLADFAVMHLVCSNMSFFPVGRISKELQNSGRNADNRYKKEAVRLAKENETMKKAIREEKAKTAKAADSASKEAKKQVKALKENIAALNASNKKAEADLKKELESERERNQVLELEIRRLKLSEKLQKSDLSPKETVESWLKDHKIIVYGGRIEFPAKVAKVTEHTENIVFADPGDKFQAGWLKNCDGVIFKVDFSGHSAFYNAKGKVVSAGVPYVYSENGSTNVDRFYEDVLLLIDEIAEHTCPAAENC